MITGRDLLPLGADVRTFIRFLDVYTLGRKGRDYCDPSVWTYPRGVNDMKTQYPASVYASAQVKYLADYPRLPFGNRVVPDFSEYLAREYAAWYDRNFMYAMGVKV